MPTINHHLVEIALGRADPTSFEKFCQAFFAALTGTEFVPLGGHHDGGAEAFDEPGVFEAKAGSTGRSKLPKKSVVLAGAEFGCFCTENLLVAHRPVMRKVADNGQLFAARLKQRSLRCQLLYAHSDPSQFGPT